MAKLVTHFTRLMNDSYIKYEDQRKNRIGIFHGNNRTNVTHTHHTLFTISLALAGNSMCTTENTTPFVRESIAGHWFSYQNASQSTYTRILVAHTIYLSISSALCISFLFHIYSYYHNILACLLYRVDTWTMGGGRHDDTECKTIFRDSSCCFGRLSIV